MAIINLSIVKYFIAIYIICVYITVKSNDEFKESEQFHKITDTKVYKLSSRYSIIIISTPKNIQRIKLRKNHDYMKLRKVSIVQQDLGPDVLNIFGKIYMLEFLKLSNNNIMCDIDLGVLSRLNVLETIDLSMNHINIVRNLETDNSFVYQSLVSIDLSSNNIAYISVYVFTHMRSLSTLLLYGNKLFRVAFLSFINSIIPSLQILSLNDNGFLCSDLNTEFPNTTKPNIIWSHEANCANRSMDDIYIKSKAVCCYETKADQLKAYPLSCCDRFKLELSDKIDFMEDMEHYTNFLNVINKLDMCLHSCSIGDGLNGNLLLYV